MLGHYIQYMAVKNFVFRQKLGWLKGGWYEKTFFAIFDPTWTHILVPKDQNKEFLKQHFSQERQKLYHQFCDFKTD